jgi:hypothetical protein
MALVARAMASGAETIGWLENCLPERRWRADSATWMEGVIEECLEEPPPEVPGPAMSGPLRQQ